MISKSIQFSVLPIEEIWSGETITIEDKQTFVLTAEGVAFFKFQIQ
jgi:hypothetical protein